MTMFRFTMRELMLVTLIVAMGLGWWLDRNNLVRVSKFKAQFWERCAIAFQDRLERDGYAVDVGHERGITIVSPSGQGTYQTGETGRSVLNIDPSEAWPKADVLVGRHL
jgi:hypothetical protein